MGFEKFKKIFDNHFDSIYFFMDEEEAKLEGLWPYPFEFELQDDLDVISHDSYGNEDSELKRVYSIKDFDIYVMFTGNRSSYQGEDWYGYKEVNKTTKTISVWK